MTRTGPVKAGRRFSTQIHLCASMGRRDSAHTKRLIAKNIRRMRRAKSWSQHDLANEAGACGGEIGERGEMSAPICGSA
ncbi:MAG: hypothetical protein QOJ86_1530 [Bradyrhizobium sp.]|nr:hypothetical protein [Bradyrhizobium sp.]